MTTPAPSDLTTLVNLQTYLVNVGSNANATLQRMISAASMAIQTYMDRNIAPQSYSKLFDGNWPCKALVVPDYPLLAVQSLTIDGNTIVPPGSISVAGYWNTDKEILLNGYRFTPGKANIAVTYTAGFQITGEAQTIPATPYQVTPKAPKGVYMSDQGVSFATGAALAAVTGTPTTGQYVAPTVANAYYQFAAADTGKGVLLNYGYVPFDLEQACIVLVQYWLGDRNRNGEKSRSMGGQTITFVTSDMPDTVRMMVNQYRRTFMV